MRVGIAIAFCYSLTYTQKCVACYRLQLMHPTERDSPHTLCAVYARANCLERSPASVRSRRGNCYRFRRIYRVTHARRFMKQPFLESLPTGFAFILTSARRSVALSKSFSGGADSCSRPARRVVVYRVYSIPQIFLCVNTFSTDYSLFFAFLHIIHFGVNI